MKYNLITARFAVIVFYSCFMVGTVISNVTIAATSPSTPHNTVSIVGFLFFVVVYNLTAPQKSSRMLIARSASRKEIFVSQILFMLPLSAFMAVLQIITLYAAGLLGSTLSRTEWTGLRFDLQTAIAPDMDNVLVFFAVSFSVFVCFSAIGYFVGACISRWKWITYSVLIVGSLVFFSCLLIPDFFTAVWEAIKFMLFDDDTAWFIVLKQLALAVPFVLAAFPIIRRITAVSSSTGSN
jgi:hypothetical protein